MNFFQSVYLSYFSSPAEHRAVYQAVNRVRPRVIMEFGLQRGIRSVNMLELAKRFHPSEQIEYCCIDPFEDRVEADGPGLSLRKAYKVLVKTGVRVQTIPNTPLSGLNQAMRNIQTVQLLVLATASNDWIEQAKDQFATLMAPKGLILMGNPTPTGKPFEFKSFTVDEFCRVEAQPLRRAA